jgi:hypothetical protein
MKNLTRIVLVTLAAAVLVSTVAVLTRRAVHARGDDIPADYPRQPWVGSCNTEEIDAGTYRCDITAPTDGVLVIQTVGFQSGLSAPSLAVALQVYTSFGSQTPFWTTLATSSPEEVEGPIYLLNITSSTTLYADPGTTIKCIEHLPPGDLIGSIQVFQLVGYYVPRR